MNREADEVCDCRLNPPVCVSPLSPPVVVELQEREKEFDQG